MLPDFVGGLLILGLWRQLTPSPGSFVAEGAPMLRQWRRKNFLWLLKLAKLSPAYANLSETSSVCSGLGLGRLRQRIWWRLAVSRYVIVLLYFG